MSIPAEITVDWTEERDSLQVIPNLPWLTSGVSGRQGLQVQLHRQPAWECPEHTFEQHVVSIHHFRDRAKSARSFAGRKQNEWLGEGDVVIMPANVPHKDRWDKPGEFTLLILDPANVTRIAEHSFDSSRIQILPRFAMRDGLIHQIGTALEAELRCGGSGIDLYWDSLTAALSAHLLRNHSSVSRLPDPSGSNHDQVRRAAEFIQDNFQQNLRLADVAAVAHLSEFHFARLFRQVMGVSPHKFLIERRIEHAQGLLRSTKLPVHEVAYRVGFSNQSHFTAHFRRIVGTTPGLYRAAL